MQRRKRDWHLGASGACAALWPACCGRPGGVGCAPRAGEARALPAPAGGWSPRGADSSTRAQCRAAGRGRSDSPTPGGVQTKPGPGSPGGRPGAGSSASRGAAEPASSCSRLPAAQPAAGCGRVSLPQRPAGASAEPPRGEVAQPSEDVLAFGRGAGSPPSCARSGPGFAATGRPLVGCGRQSAGSRREGGLGAACGDRDSRGAVCVAPLGGSCSPNAAVREPEIFEFATVSCNPFKGSCFSDRSPGHFCTHPLREELAARALRLHGNRGPRRGA